MCFILSKLTINVVFLSLTLHSKTKGVLFFVLAEERAQNLSQSITESVWQIDMLPLSLTDHAFVQHQCVFKPSTPKFIHWWSTVGSSVTGILHVL